MVNSGLNLDKNKKYFLIQTWAKAKNIASLVLQMATKTAAVSLLARY